MITFQGSGTFKKTNKMLNTGMNIIDTNDLRKLGKEGVASLKANTPKKSGVTADSWKFRTANLPDVKRIMFDNTNEQNGVLVAAMIQYGHATRNGGWIPGYDYINPTIRPVFDKFVDYIWEGFVK